ncbi:ataxin-10-like isoform X2 [Dysidea avara]|uniref:ataxin-10-like isoform X2 n=1 Tax=Dysidea avara TaxID=196820 RepID=UPI00331FE29D
MGFSANFNKLSQQFGKDGIGEACRTLEELLIESKLLVNRSAVLPGHIQILHGVIENLCSDVTLWCNADRNSDQNNNNVTCLELALKLARNLCAEVQANQAMICDSPIVGVVLGMMEGVVTRKALPRLEDVAIAGLQLLGNVCVEYSAGQEKVWTLMFPSMFCKLLSEESTAVSEMCYMIAHNCTLHHVDNMKNLCSNEELTDILWSQILTSKAELEWGLLLLEQAITSGFIGTIYLALESRNSQLHLTLLEVVLDKIGDSNSCALPEELPEGNKLCYVDAGDVMFLAKQFEKCAAANSDMNEINKNYKILMSLLHLLNSLSLQLNNLKLLQQFPQLLESAAGLLQTLCVQDGTADSAQNKTNLRDVTVLRDDFDYPLFGLKKNLVRLLGNLCYGDRSNQDKIRECGAIMLLLNQCSIDDSNPYIQQWTIWAVRNICHDNEENQKMIKSLENHGLTNDTPVMGLQVEVGDDGKLKAKR